MKAKCGGRGVSEAQRLETVEDENPRLKSLLTDVMIAKATLNEWL